jgi:hypothetical protein
LFQRFAAAFLAISARRSGDWILARLAPFAWLPRGKDGAGGPAVKGSGSVRNDELFHHQKQDPSLCSG